MGPSQKSLLRAAAKIRQALLRRRGSADWRLPVEAWEALIKVARKAEQAQRCGWHRAARVLRDDLAFAADLCQAPLAKLADNLRDSALTKPLATEAEIFRDLLALEKEFEAVACDLLHHEVRATTPPIILEGFELGPFEIRLDWTRLSQSPAYRIVALEPNPCAADESVTHPHVRSGVLCEGDGQLAIRTALAEGRIGDFFLIVAQTLGTYSRGNAYVELDDWDGSLCSQCGSVGAHQDRYGCQGCNATLCGNCTSFCDSCECDFCSECIASCEQCDRTCCVGCLTRCRSCGSAVCGNCREDDRMCQSCFNNRHSEEEGDGVTIESDCAAPTAVAGVAVQSQCLGEAAVSS